MAACAGVAIQLLAVLTSALDGGEWSASWPGRFMVDGRLDRPHKW
jgi:hypothetical protein